jgi:hypothetical protein
MLPNINNSLGKLDEFQFCFESIQAFIQKVTSNEVNICQMLTISAF